MKKFWTKEKCQEVALKYNSRVEFQRKSVSGYLTAQRNGWLNDICQHMIRPIPYNKIWTKEKCKLEALKYETKTEFFNKSLGAYLSAQRNNWLNDVCQHMIILRTKWNYILCKQEALKYSSRTEFYNKCGGAYEYATRHKFLDEICKHMTTIGSLKRRCIYVAEFEDNFIYVGLTYNYNKRISRHLNDDKSQIYSHIQLTNYIPKFKQLTEYLNIEEAKQMERYYVDYYQKKNYNILNVANTGAIGGATMKWTKELCQIEAIKYKSKTEFQKNSCGAYTSAYRNKWLDDVCSHMIKTKYWYNKN